MENRNQLAKYFADLGFTKGAEIGVAAGDFSEVLLTTIPNLKLYCIDVWLAYRGNPWSGSSKRGPDQFEIATKKLSNYNAEIIREMSMDAVKKFENGSLDFVYIDANHAFDFVMEDLIAWSRKVRVGGIIAGDDYYPFKKAGVIEAVDTYTKVHGIIPNFTKVSGSVQPNYWWIKK